MNIAYIMERYNSGEITLEEANAELAALGAGISLKPLTDEERAAKAQREDEEGFFDPAEKGLEPKEKVTLEKADMRRRPELAGLIVVQKTKIGYWAVHYNEDGYATKASRVNFS